MKTTSIDIIKSLIFKVQTNIITVNDEDKKHIIDQLSQVIRAEMPESKGKFNWNNYICKDLTRNTVCGVYHMDGFKVATDLQIMVARKEDYPKDFDSKLLKKDGTLDEVRFPDWKSIVPDIWNRKESSAWKIDIKAIADFVKDEKAYKKSGLINKGFVVRCGDVYFNPENFYRMAVAMQYIGTDTFYTVGKGRAAIAYRKEGYEEGYVALMPMYWEHFRETYPDIAYLDVEKVR